ncbi:hypothetical protein ACFPK9_00950 [Rubritalea spongiae]|uniref:hypothetical protein n=1 Tax=Rubritalea spongiae TaxID=430797 RepID=UPI00361EE650
MDQDNTDERLGGWSVLPCRSKHWSYHLDEALTGLNVGGTEYIERLNNGGGILVRYQLIRPNGEVVFDSIENQLLTKIDLTLAGLSEGMYELVITLDSGMSLPSFRFVYAPSLSWRPGVGVYEWFNRDQSEQKSPRAAERYEVAFKERESYWRYFLMTNSLLNTHQYKLECESLNGVDVQFGPACLSLDPHRRSAIMFRSKKLLPMRQSPSGKVILEIAGDVWGQLPYAQTEVRLEKKLGKLIPVSDIYVQV